MDTDVVTYLSIMKTGKVEVNKQGSSLPSTFLITYESWWASEIEIHAENYL